MNDAVRRRLPDRRRTIAVKISAGGMGAHAHVGFDDLGRAREVFLRPRGGAKVGSAVDALCDDAAILLSLALQYGVPLEQLRLSLSSTGGEPATLIGAAVDALLDAPSLEAVPPPPRLPLQPPAGTGEAEA